MALPSTSSFKKWVSLSAVLGFAAFLIYVIFFSDITDVAGVLDQTNIIIYASAFAFVLVGTAFDALAWKGFLKNVGVHADFRKVFNLSWVGSFVDVLVPGGWSGDIFKTYLLTKESKVDGAKAAASIVIKNVLESLITLTFLITGMVLLMSNYTWDGGIMIAVGTTMFLLSLPSIIAIYLSTHITASEKLFRGLKRLSARINRKNTTATDFDDKIRNSLNEFHEGIMTIKTKPKSILKPLTFQILSWTFNVLTLLIIFASLGQLIGFDKILITNTIVNNIQCQGVALVGVAQMVSSTIYMSLGISSALSIASSLLAGFASF